MDTKFCSDYYTQFCNKWKGGEKLPSFILNNAIDLTTKVFEYNITLYQILQGNYLSLNDIKVITKNLENPRIKKIHIIRNNPARETFDIVHEKLIINNFNNWQGLKFTDIVKLFDNYELNILCFDNIFFNSDTLDYCNFFSRNDVGIISSEIISGDIPEIVYECEFKNIENKHRELYDFSALIFVGQLNVECDYYVNYAGTRNLLIQKINSKNLNIVNISNYIRSFMINVNPEYTENFNYYLTPTFSIVFAIPFTDKSLFNDEIHFEISDKLRDPVNFNLTDVVDVNTIEFKQKAKYLDITDKIEISTIMNSIIHDFYWKQKQLVDKQLDQSESEINKKKKEEFELFIQEFKKIKQQKENDMLQELALKKHNAVTTLENELKTREIEKMEEQDNIIKELFNKKLLHAEEEYDKEKDDAYSKVQAQIESFYIKGIADIKEKLEYEEKTLREIKLEGIKNFEDEIKAENAKFLVEGREKALNEIEQIKHVLKASCEEKIRFEVMQKYENTYLEKISELTQSIQSKKKVIFDQINLESRILRDKLDISNESYKHKKMREIDDELSEYKAKAIEEIETQIDDYAKEVRTDVEEKCNKELIEEKSKKQLEINSDLLRHQTEIIDTINKKYESKKLHLNLELEAIKQQKLKVIEEQVRIKEKEICEQQVLEREKHILAAIEHIKENKVKELDQDIKVKKHDFEKAMELEKLKLINDNNIIKQEFMNELNDFKRKEITKQSEEIDKTYNEYKDKLVLVNSQLKDNLRAQLIDEEERLRSDMILKLKTECQLEKERFIEETQEKLIEEREAIVEEFKLIQENELASMKENFVKEKEKLINDFQVFKDEVHENSVKFKEEYDRNTEKADIELEKQRIDFHNRKIKLVKEDIEDRRIEIDSELQKYKEERIRGLELEVIRAGKELTEREAMNREVNIMSQLQKIKEIKLRAIEIEMAAKHEEMTDYIKEQQIKIEEENRITKRDFANELNKFKVNAMAKQTAELETIYADHKEKLHINHDKIKQKLALERKEEHEQMKNNLEKEVELERISRMNILQREMSNEVFQLNEAHRNNKSILESKHLKELEELKDELNKHKHECDNELENYREKINTEIQNVSKKVHESNILESQRLAQKREEYHNSEIKRITAELEVRIQSDLQFKKDQQLENHKKELEIIKKQEIQDIKHELKVLREISKSKVDNEIDNYRQQEQIKLNEKITEIRKEQEIKLAEEYKKKKELADEEIKKRLDAVHTDFSKIFED